MFPILGCSGCHKKMPRMELLKQQKSTCSQFYRLVAQGLGSTGVGFLKMAPSLAFRRPASHYAFSATVLGGLERELSSLLTTATGSVPVCELLQSCPILCYSMDCGPPGSSVHGILQARILGWVSMPSSGDLPDPGMELTSLMSPALAGRFFTTGAAWKA